MREPTRRGPPRAADNDDEGGLRAPTRPRGSRAEELLEMADAMEEQGRALLTQARQLQRIAQGMERSGGEDRPAPRARPERSERPERGAPSERSAPRYGSRGGAPTRSGPGPRGTAPRRNRDEEEPPREAKPRRGPGKPPGKGPAKGPPKGRGRKF